MHSGMATVSEKNSILCLISRQDNKKNMSRDSKQIRCDIPVIIR